MLCFCQNIPTGLEGFVIIVFLVSSAAGGESVLNQISKWRLAVEFLPEIQVSCTCTRKKSEDVAYLEGARDIKYQTTKATSLGKWRRNVPALSCTFQFFV